MGARPLTLLLSGFFSTACGDTDKSSAFEGIEANASVDGAPRTTASTATAGSSSAAATSSATGGAGPTGSGGSGGAAGNLTTTSGTGGATVTTGASIGGSGGASGASGGASDADNTSSTGGASTDGGGTTIPIEGLVDIVESCEFTPCGGDLANTSWQYSRICIQRGDLLDLVDTCPDLELLESSGQVSGTLTFDDSSFERDVSLSITSSYRLPPSCFVATCVATGAMLATVMPGSSCTDDSGDCICTVPTSGTDTTSGSFSQSGNALTLGDETAQYCATQAAFQYTGSLESLPFVLETIPF